MKYSVVEVGQHAGIHAGIPTLQLVVLLVDSHLTKAGPGDELLAKARFKPREPRRNSAMQTFTY